MWIMYSVFIILTPFHTISHTCILYPCGYVIFMYIQICIILYYSKFDFDYVIL